MTYDIGDVWSGEVFVYDDNGALANAGAVALTITKPDGTTTSPSVTNASTGRYTATYTITVNGLHKVSWVATGANASAYQDSFDVRSSTTSIISLDDAKAFLNISSTTYDAELQGFVDVVSQAVEDITGRKFRRQAAVETFDGGDCRVVLSGVPVQSVTSVTESGTTLTASDYTVTQGGVVVRRWGTYGETAFLPGTLNVVVTYVTGYTDPPDTVTHAAKVMLHHLWTTQRGTMPTARAGLDEDFLPGTTYSVPRRVLELLNPYTLPGIA